MTTKNYNEMVNKIKTTNDKAFLIEKFKQYDRYLDSKNSWQIAELFNLVESKLNEFGWSDKIVTNEVKYSILSFTKVLDADDGDMVNVQCWTGRETINYIISNYVHSETGCLLSEIVMDMKIRSYAYVIDGEITNIEFIF